MKSKLRFTAIGLFLMSSSSFTAFASDIETVVVSATRTELSVSDAPSNIAILNEDQLTRTQAEHIQQHLAQVPGVSMQRGDGQESLPGIRSAVLTGAGACASVLIMEEGIPVRGPAFCNVNELFDTHFEQASQIEVTRGPGTSFYGSNSLTGSVNVHLPSQGNDFVAFEVGSDSYRRLKTGYSYAGETSKGRFYATITDADSFRQEAGYEQQKVSWRQASSLADWKLDLGLTFTRLDQQTAGFITGLDSYRSESLSEQNLDPEAFRKTKSLRAWAKLSRQVAQGYKLQVTPYLRSTDMDFLLHFLPGDPLEQNKQTGIGWQSSLSGGMAESVSWSVGLDADFSDGELLQTQSEPTQGSAFLQATIPTGIHYDYQVDAQQFAAFGHIRWAITDSLSLISGVRAERLEYDYDNLTLDGRTRDDGTECGFGGCRYSRPADGSDSFSELSPKLELQYSLSDASKLHFSAASSFRAPQATELYRLQRQQQVANLDSVRADNIEVGFSYQGERTQFVASIYAMQQQNVIIRDSDFFNIDGNEIDSQGLEVSFLHNFSESVMLNVAATMADHEYASDQFSGDVNINGNQVDTAPKRLVNSTLSWRASDSFSAQLEWQHTDSYFLEPENTRRYPGHDVWHMRADYKVSDRLKVMARILNISDTRYAERADFTSFTDERYFPGQPRSFYLGVRYDINALN